MNINKIMVSMIIMRKGNRFSFNKNLRSEFVSNSIDEFFCIEIFSLNVFLSIDKYSEIFGHLSTLNCLNDRSFNCLRENFQFLILIEFCSVFESPAPCKNTSH